MSIDISASFRDLLARNRGPDPSNPERRCLPDYAVSAVLDGRVIEATLRFKAGAAYCCMEWGCHLGLIGPRWSRLRSQLASNGVEVQGDLDLHLAVDVEQGALFFDLSRPDPSRRGWYAFAQATAHHYDVIAKEGVTQRG
jgi:hypothetical protein